MTPLEIRPFRLRIVAYTVATVLVVVFALVGWALTRTDSGVRFGLVDQALMTGIGLFLGAVAVGLSQARVVADAEGIRVRNALRETYLPWTVVRAVRFDDGAPWATLELQDDQTVTLFAVQASDGPRAAVVVEGLRELREQSQRRP